MRAVVITCPGGPEVLAIQELETPQPVGEQVRVRVHAAGLNRADLAQRKGSYPAPPGVPSNIPGLEFAGEVDAVGSLVTKWQPGQRVMGIVGGGSQAEYLLSHQDLLIAIPSNLDYIGAAAIPEVFITAHDALFSQGDLRMGERVLIHAAGSGVGTAAIQLAHAAGATVYGTSRTPAKLEKAMSLGLDVGLSEQDFVAQIKDLTHGAGVHMILDFVGAAYIEQNLAALALWGRLVFLATMGGAQASVPLGLVMAKRLQLRGSTLRTRTLEEKLTATRRFSSAVLPLLESAKVVPIVGRVYPLREIAAAHQAMAENKNFGKLILRID